MKTILRVIGGAAVLGAAGLAAFVFVPVQRTAAVTDLPADWTAPEGAGEYVMYAGDCMACHTAEGGQPFAGGRAIHSPMGTIWSTNITPDPETGIGGYSLDEFRAAMIDGIRADRAHLYPAMPYENYRLMTEEDIRALYQYFMEDVQPVNNAVEATALSFPFNMRFGIRAWNWLALSHDAGPAVSGDTPEDRGAYLVDGAGHCAACHSPRTAFMSQDGITKADANYLTGGEVDGWHAPALRGPGSAPKVWAVEEMAAYLSTGRNAHSAANGEMGLVVRDSLQHLTDEDNLAIATYLRTMDGAPETASVAEAATTTETMLTEATDLDLGARLYLDNCSACHFVDGKGAAEIFPELANNSIVTAPQIGGLANVILHGAELPSTEHRPMKLKMQGYADRLSDEEVAALATFLRQAWGNDAPPVAAADIAPFRAQAAH
ncbi:cytochrome c [Falsirhodobacter xinxiangensis]|uniref:cytochrome c n=1 Tax=Falsirhodobacter xinxiangensis TaxID=2530049 RepID=UPI0010AA879F|nr:cytochrome c [Rhodobacter xinxiangensis]